MSVEELEELGLNDAILREECRKAGIVTHFEADDDGDNARTLRRVAFDHLMTLAHRA